MAFSYGTLLGTQFFQVCFLSISEPKDRLTVSLQSFVGGIVAYKALPRPQFSSLQQAIFPIYFSMQTALPIVLALTVPGERTPLGGTPSGLGGFLTEKNRVSVLVPILTIFATSLANLLFIGPATTRIMRERKHQGNLHMSKFLTLRDSGELGLTQALQRRKMARRATIAHLTRKRWQG